MSHTYNWIEPRIIVGPQATGDYFYERPEITNAIWAEIKKGSHILLAAPRRVGKSSVMIYMKNNCPDDLKCEFENIQGITSSSEFYQRLYELILSCVKKQHPSWDKFKKLINIEEISVFDISLKFGKTTLNFKEKIEEVLVLLSSNDLKLVLFLDELPEVLHVLNREKKTDEANEIVKNLRRWRQSTQNHNLCLVLAGSVGIHNIIESIAGRTSDINDIKEVTFTPLSLDEAKKYVEWATNEASVKYNDELKTYLLHKVKNYIPYFINLMLDEVNLEALRKQNHEITFESIDQAFDKIVKNNSHFSDWKNRLFEYLSDTDAAFSNEILIYISHHESVSIRKVYDLAIKHQKTNNYMKLIRGLTNDGYIIEQEGAYVFVSPFLQAFWKRDNPIYDE